MTNQEEFGCQAAASLPLIRIVNQESRAEDSPWREIRKILTRGLCGDAGDNMLVIAGVFGGICLFKLKHPGAKFRGELY